MGIDPNTLKERSKFFTVNIKKLNGLIDTLADDNKYNVNSKDLKALLYILGRLEFNTNIITIPNMTKKHIMQDIGMSESAFRHFITKMNKLEIFVDKRKNDMYEVNSELLNFGDNSWEAGEYIKVSSRGLSHDLEKSQVNLSATEIKIFLFLLTTIHFRDDSLLSNTVDISKPVRESLIEKFEISARSFDNFMKKMKETKLLLKINNTLYKVNTKYITFGGDLDPMPYPKENVARDMKKRIPKNLEWLFEEGGDKNGK